MFVYYSDLLLIFRLPRTSRHIGTLRATLTLSVSLLAHSSSRTCSIGGTHIGQSEAIDQRRPPRLHYTTTMLSLSC